MDQFQVHRLREEHQKGLQLCEDKIKKWEKFKTDYETLKDRIETLPDCLSYDITVPFGNSAFTKGQLVHTNEVLVLLGDNWFAEVSAKQASAIASRRINQCVEMLDGLNREKQQYENWLNYIEEVSGSQELVEIIEDYDDAKEKKWREQHARNVKAYKQKLAEENSKDSLDWDEIGGSDEDYLEKLDKLELQEIESDSKDVESDSKDVESDSKDVESDSKDVESDRSAVDCSDDGSHSEEHSYKPKLKLQINGSFHRKTSESETGEDGEVPITPNSPNDAVKNDKHVRWHDLSKQTVKKITFKHSKPKKPNTPSSKYKGINSSEDESHSIIESPSDIYKYFGDFLHSSPPKSILKVKSPPPFLDSPVFTLKEPTPKETSPDTDESVSIAFTNEVRECSSPIHIVQNNKSSRPVSHFKNSRKNRKR